MLERPSNYDNTLGEYEIQRQIELVTRISQTSDVLFSYLGEGIMWHLFPKFGKPPPISLGGYRISDKLKAMAKQTKDLLVTLNILPQKYNNDFPQVACYVWEINPPLDKKLPGFGLKVVCPKLTKEVTPDNLEEYRKSGSIDVDILTWSEDGEARYDSTKPESVLLEIIRKHPTARLKTALWILQGLPHSQINSRRRESFKL